VIINNVHGTKKMMLQVELKRLWKIKRPMMLIPAIVTTQFDRS